MFLFQFFVCFDPLCAGDVDSLSAGNAGHTIPHYECLQMKCLLILIAMLLHRIVHFNHPTGTKT